MASPSQLHALVYEFLIQSGLNKAANKFSKEVGGNIAQELAEKQKSPDHRKLLDIYNLYLANKPSTPAKRKRGVEEPANVKKQKQTEVTAPEKSTNQAGTGKKAQVVATPSSNSSDSDSDEDESKEVKASTNGKTVPLSNGQTSEAKKTVKSNNASAAPASDSSSDSDSETKTLPTKPVVATKPATAGSESESDSEDESKDTKQAQAQPKPVEPVVPQTKKPLASAKALPTPKAEDSSSDSDSTPTKQEVPKVSETKKKQESEQPKASKKKKAKKVQEGTAVVETKTVDTPAEDVQKSVKNGKKKKKRGWERGEYPISTC